MDCIDTDLRDKDDVGCDEEKALRAGVGRPSDEEKKETLRRIKMNLGICIELPALRRRKDYVDSIKKDLGAYYGYNDLLAGVFMEMFSPKELLNAIDEFEVPRPTCLRVNTLKTCAQELVYLLLLKRGVYICPEIEEASMEDKTYSGWSEFWLVLRRDSKVKVPLEATPEYEAGHYMVQTPSCFFPAMVLDPKQDEKIVELVAAAPGVKTTHIATLMNNTGSLYANEMDGERIHLLNENIKRLGVTNTSVGNLDGRELPNVLGINSQDRVLLDAPCSQTGVISADDPVKSTISCEEIQKCADMQKQLLLAAIDLVDANSKSGGYVVYSTRSIMVEENEAVIAFALENRNVELVPCGIPYGCHGYTKFKEHKFHISMKMTRRYYPSCPQHGWIVHSQVEEISGVKSAAETDEVDVVGKGSDEAIYLGINKKRKTRDESDDLCTNKTRRRRRSGFSPVIFYTS